ncbi:MAG: 23S rRNA (adenine(2503)-C(2))-methyltransferase RlmN [Lentisphaerae bacterium]|nr:23S rRNA (adenine(2503)-C(2))-methyltransferase RlmN [Lentisphaerota bacterium]
MEPKPHMLNLSQADLQALLQEWGEPAYRARQIYRHLYVNLATDPAAMTDLPKALRERLTTDVDWAGLRLQRTLSCDDGLTRKALFSVSTGAPAESVLMVYPDRATVCVSSQSGCLMRCTFCATGRLGLLGQLTTGQIVEQVLWAERELRSMRERPPSHDQVHLLTNVVFMGMGEPFNNYDAWWAAVERLHDPQGFNMGARNFTVSTVGLVPGIRRLAAATLPVNLAISLHAPNDALRSSLMPVNKAFPIADLLAATRDYIAKTRRRVSFEYVLLEGKNDLPAHAEELATLLRSQYPPDQTMLFHVNLIPWNPVPGAPLERSHRARVLAFQDILEARRVPCTVRVERGSEIAAACGQLAGMAQDEAATTPAE